MKGKTEAGGFSYGFFVSPCALEGRGKREPGVPLSWVVLNQAFKQPSYDDGDRG